MDMLITGLMGLVGIGSLICFVMVLIAMFQNGRTGLGIVCIVLALCAGLGGLIAFIVGWVKASEWGIKNVMLVWTGCIIINIILAGLAGATGALQFGPAMDGPNL